MNRLRVFWLALVAMVLLAPSAWAESPRSMMVELHIGPYAPQVDRAFKHSSPYQEIFGSNEMVMFGFHWDYQVYQGFGTIGLGVGARYGWVDGQSISESTSEAADETSLSLIPLTASVTYRFDWLAQKWNVPIVPYGKAGFTYTMWWITNGNDEIANTYDLEGTGRTGYGGTFGFHVAGGVQILLDWVAPGMAAEFDNEVGVNNSYIFIEYGLHSVNDFGSSKSFDLGDDNFSAGLMFEF